MTTAQATRAVTKTAAAMDTPMIVAQETELPAVIAAACVAVAEERSGADAEIGVLSGMMLVMSLLNVRIALINDLRARCRHQPVEAEPTTIDHVGQRQVMDVVAQTSGIVEYLLIPRTVSMPILTSDDNSQSTRSRRIKHPLHLIVKCNFIEPSDQP